MGPSILPKTSISLKTSILPKTRILQTTTNSRVKPLFFHRQSVASTCDSAGGIATPPPEDLDDEQNRALLASPLYMQEREAHADRTQVYRSVRENLMSSSSQDPKSTERPVALYSSKNRLNQETFSDRGDFSSEHHQVL